MKDLLDEKAHEVLLHWADVSRITWQRSYELCKFIDSSGGQEFVAWVVRQDTKRYARERGHGF